PQESFTLIEGEDEVLQNVLLWNQGFTKTVCVMELLESLPTPGRADLQGGVPGGRDPECFQPIIGLAGVNVVVYENIGEDFLGAQVAGDIVFEGITGPDGTVSGLLPPGDYILCIYDEDGVATATNGEVVVPDLP